MNMAYKPFQKSDFAVVEVCFDLRYEVRKYIGFSNYGLFLERFPIGLVMQ